MVVVRPVRASIRAFITIAVVLLASASALAQDGSVLTTLENQVVTSARGWETTVLDAARSLFWILAVIEIGIAAVWLAINAASLDSWFAELVRRIMFIGLFAFILDQGPTVSKAIVDSLFQIGSSGGSASPADIFNAGIGRQLPRPFTALIEGGDHAQPVGAQHLANSVAHISRAKDSHSVDR